MRPVLGLLVVLSWVLVGCQRDPELSTTGLALRQLPSCPVVSEGQLSLLAAGDFPTRRQEVSSARQGTVDSFPVDTRWLAIEAETADGRAGALVAMRGETFARSALMLPLGQSCPLGDPLAAAPIGAALAALPEGGMLIAGGRDERGAASSIARLLQPGETLASQVEGGMLLRRSGATATRLGERVIVAGGAPDERGPAHDTYEVYDLQRAGFDQALSEKLTIQRRDHGAARLPDGRLLLVGGRSEVDGVALASAELILPEGGPAQRLEARLEVARISAQVMVLDSGKVLIVGGRDADGRPVGAVERFDPETERFETVLLREESHPVAVAAALEGNRVAWLGCELDGECELSLVMPSELDYRVEVATPIGGLEDLAEPRMLGLPDGRLLLVARRASGNVALLIDPGRMHAETVDASRAADQLLMLDDGTIAELDRFGSSLRRLGLRSALHDPPALDPGDPEGGLVIDAAGGLLISDGALRSQADDARVDQGTARFDGVRIELVMGGEGTLLLEPLQAPAIEIVIGDGRVAVGDCSIAREGEAVSVVRRGTGLRIAAGGESRSCEAAQLDGRVEVALRLRAGAALMELSTTRL